MTDDHPRAAAGPVFDRFPDFPHQRVIFCQDPGTGLRAIHDSTLGPAFGGTRFHPYPTEAAALTDGCRRRPATGWRATCRASPSSTG